jgi:hypothetical protein
MVRQQLRLIAAHHEAGHAIVAHKLGVTVRSVSIDQDGGGVTKHNRIVGNERAILISLAGPYAQRRYAPKSHWRARSHTGFKSGRDFDDVVDLIYAMHGTGKAAEAYHRYVEARAEQPVEQHWKQIEHLAQQLVQHGTVTGEAMKASWGENKASVPPRRVMNSRLCIRPRKDHALWNCQILARVTTGRCQSRPKCAAAISGLLDHLVGAGEHC